MMDRAQKRATSVVEPVAHQEIVELYARYCQSADADAAEAWADCFTSDGDLCVDGEVI